MIGNISKIKQWLDLQKEDKLYEIDVFKSERNKKQNSRYWKLLYKLS